MKSAARFVVVFWGVAVAGPFLIPICLAAFIAFLLAPMVRAMRSRRVPEWVCIATSTVLLLIPLTVMILGLVNQGQRLISQLPSIVQSLSLSLAGVIPAPIIEKLSAEAMQGMSSFVGGLAELVNGVSRSLLIVVFAVLMIANRGRLRRVAEHLVSQSPSLDGPALVREVPKLIQRYLFARFWIGLGVSATCVVTLALFGIPYSFFLGGFLGLMTFMPAIGYLVGVVPMVAVAVSSGHSGPALLCILGVVLVCNVIDGYYLTPKFVGNRVNINALMVFVGLFAGGLIWGAWGIFLSLPILSVLRIFLSAIPAFEPWGDVLTSQSDGRVIRLSPLSEAGSTVRARS